MATAYKQWTEKTGFKYAVVDSNFTKVYDFISETPIKGVRAKKEKLSEVANILETETGKRDYEATDLRLIEDGETEKTTYLPVEVWREYAISEEEYIKLKKAQ